MSDERAGRNIAPRDDLALMKGYHSPQLEVEVRLNTNEAPEMPPAAFLDALQREIGSIAFNRYPDRGALALRQKIAELHGVTAEQVFCANGSNEVIQSVLLAYGGPGRFAAVFEPTYALHSHIAKITGTGLIVGERDEQFLIDKAELDRVFGDKSQAKDSPAVTFLCSPNNPTGRLEPRPLIEATLSKAPGLVLVDEAYGEFAPWSALELIAENPHLIVVRTFSKTWSLAALRLGYAIADPAVIANLEHVALPYHLDSIKQAAGTLALEFADAMHERVARLVEERGRLSAALNQLPLEVVPSDANFILFRVLSRDAREVWNELVEHSVLVRDLSSWPRLEGCLRVTVGTPAENDAFLAGITASLT